MRTEKDFGTYPGIKVLAKEGADIYAMLRPILSNTGISFHDYREGTVVVVNPTTAVRAAIEALEGLTVLGLTTVVRTGSDHAEETHPKARIHGLVRDGKIFDPRGWLQSRRNEGEIGRARVEGTTIITHISKTAAETLRRSGCEVEYI